MTTGIFASLIAHAAHEQEQQGHQVVRRGKKIFAAEFERKLVGRMKPDVGRRAGDPGRGLARKVLEREDFGLCVLLPKTAWERLPASGQATVTVDGVRRRVTVQSERCNCRGTGWHEHRFLSLPRAAAAGASQRVVIEL